MAVAAVAWALGTLPSLTMASGDSDTGSGPPLAVVIAAAAAMGLVFGSAFGPMQGRVLRPYATNAIGRWTIANALGWAAALVWIFTAPPSPPPPGRRRRSSLSPRSAVSSPACP